MLDSKLLEQDEYLRRLVELIVASYKPTKIFLFGSKARGDSEPDSDYDLMVVVPKKVSYSAERKFHQKKISSGLHEPTDIALWTTRTFDEQLQLKCTLPTTVISEGRLLYEAA